MQYRFTEDRDWSDLSAGRVLRSRPGHTAFPARLANEIFRTCAELCERSGHCGPYAVYDPCCGSGVLLTEVALLNPQRIYQVVGSDLDPQVLETARNNLQLLTVEGATKRAREIESDYLAYRKQSHKEALESAHRILEQVRLDRQEHSLAARVLQIDATQITVQNSEAIGRTDIVLADVPYGIQSHWTLTQHAASTPIHLLLGSLLTLPGKPLVAIAAGKKARVEHGNYRRLRRFSAGKRQIVLLRAD